MEVTARDLKLLAIGAVVSVGLTALLTSQYHNNVHTPSRIIDSPLPLIQRTLTKEQQKRLPYAPDALEGARDVETPFGSIRVYEWGPEDGKKVLLVHGISTPCVALGGLADELVQQGCRVILFDLFGRGFSSTPDPATQPQDIQLFTTQILLVLSSSPLSWTGDGNRFGLIGYSLGGGIAASFTSYFPNLVESLVLIAPAGLMRSERIHWTSKLLYGGLLPQRLVEYLVTASKAADEEAPSHPALMRDSSAQISARRPSVSIADVVSWQLTHHAGFVPAFVSSIQHAPISAQNSSWKSIAARQLLSPNQRLLESKVLLLLGKDDTVVIADEMSEDAKEALGDAVDIRVMDGGHELPVTDANVVAQTILDFWNQA
ncbi:alpha/beta-hydrolase, partial [Aureobasidium melanogenum]|uniref:Alpha/beta-hydrolase n=1 Tax=Aureobasidium melanogenum (strain CBS 110374) TaxID=1043003 RepID=A0A074VR54_AURM1